MAYEPIAVSERVQRIKAEYRLLAVPQDEDSFVEKKYRFWQGSCIFPSIRPSSSSATKSFATSFSCPI